METEILQRLKHPHIINFFRVWMNAACDQVCFTTEIVTSGTLKQYVTRVRRVKRKIVKKWLIQILKGLVYLHSHTPPIIHRDLKCDNIFIHGSTGEIRIGDFGLSVARHNTTVKSVLGTPEFMAPELYDESYTEGVDIYAFGMVVLEIVTNEYPYQECTNAAQIWKRVSAGIKPQALDKIRDPEVKAFCELCLSDAETRPSAAELLNHPFLSYSSSDPRDNNIILLTADTEDEEPPRPVTPPPIREPSEDLSVQVAVETTSDENVANVNLQICFEDQRKKQIKFQFDLVEDTPLEVASEMVAELELPDPDATAELIAEKMEVEVLAATGETISEHQENYQQRLAVADKDAYDAVAAHDADVAAHKLQDSARAREGDNEGDFGVRNTNNGEPSEQKSPVNKNNGNDNNGGSDTEVNHDSDGGGTGNHEGSNSNTLYTVSVDPATPVATPPLEPKSAPPPLDVASSNPVPLTNSEQKATTPKASPPTNSNTHRQSPSNGSNHTPPEDTHNPKNTSMRFHRTRLLEMYGGMSAKKLKQVIAENGGSTSGLLEKSELVNYLVGLKHPGLTSDAVDESELYDTTRSGVSSAASASPTNSSGVPMSDSQLTFHSDVESLSPQNSKDPPGTSREPSTTSVMSGETPSNNDAPSQTDVPAPITLNIGHRKGSHSEMLNLTKPLTSIRYMSLPSELKVESLRKNGGIRMYFDDVEKGELDALEAEYQSDKVSHESAISSATQEVERLERLLQVARDSLAEKKTSWTARESQHRVNLDGLDDRATHRILDSIRSSEPSKHKPKDVHKKAKVEDEASKAEESILSSWTGL